MKHLFPIWLISVFFFHLAFGQQGNKTDELRNQTIEVSKRILSVVDSIPNGLKWPPQIEIVVNDGVNAFASVKEGKPVIIIHSSLAVVTDGINDRVAYIVGHELAHLLKGHCSGSGLSSNQTYNAMFTRENEEEADLIGLKLLLKAGYSYSEAVNTFKMMREKFGDYSPLEAQAVNHPSWSQRLEYLDKAQSKLWRNMSAFSNGVTLLFTQNYEAAIVCFQKVTKEFPGCFEAFFDMGYACLMQYCDLFEDDDIKYFNIGQVVVGGFYRRPESLERQIRGMNEELWWNAIGYFKDALRINPGLSLAKAYLGLAYFLDPRKQNIGNSERYFNEALKMVQNDETLDPILKACVYLNAGAVDIALDDFPGAKQKIDSARVYQKLSKQNSASSLSVRSNVVSSISFPSLIDYALDFDAVINKYRNNPNSLVINDLRLLLRYLRNSDPASVWWEYAYSLYTEFALKLNEKPVSMKSLTDEIIAKITPVSSVTVEKFPIFLSQNINDILSKFKNYVQIPIVDQRKISRYQFPDQKIELIAGKEVMMIIIKQFNPAIHLGVKKALYKNIAVGVYWNSVKSRFDNLLVERLPLDDKTYMFYYEAGIGFLISKTNQISEILITQKPTENKL
jgi:tetratricopeptide (TPR) repeat protein